MFNKGHNSIDPNSFRELLPSMHVATRYTKSTKMAPSEKDVSHGILSQAHLTLGDSLLVERLLVIERLRVRVPAGAAGELSSPEVTFCADSYSMSVPRRVTTVARKRPRSFCQKCR